MKTYPHKNIIKLAQSRGSTAKTMSGARRHLLRNLPAPITGREVADWSNGSDAYHRYMEGLIERRADGRASILDYDLNDQYTPGRILDRAYNDNREWDRRREIIPTRDNFGAIYGRNERSQWDGHKTVYPQDRPNTDYWDALALIAEAARKKKIPQAYDNIDFDKQGRADGDALHSELYDFGPKAAIVCIRRTEGSRYGVRTLNKSYTLIKRQGRGLRVTPATGPIAKWAKAAGEQWGLVIRRIQGDKNAIALTNPLQWQTAYKAVAIADDGSLHSIYNGDGYALGKLYKEKTQDNHNGGYYCYNSLAEALQAEVPASSKMLAASRVIVRCDVAGRSITYGNKISYTYIRPVEVVASRLEK